jgi:hypothetical protein
MVAQKVMPLIFVAVKINCWFVKITQYEEWGFDSIPYFSTKSPPTSMVLCSGGTSVGMLCQYHALSCSCSQDLTVQITLSSVSNFIVQSAYFRAPNGWKSEDARLGL